MPQTEALQNSSEDFKAELQLVLNSIVEALCGVDREGNCTFCNDSFLRMTGFSRDEVLGKNLHDLVHHSRPDGSEYPRESCPFSAAVSANRYLHQVGEVLCRKDGTCFPAEHWLHPVKGAFGTTRFVMTILDITDREQAAETLRVTQQRFEQISNNIKDVFYLGDISGKIVYVSPAFETVWGYPCEALSQNPTLWLESIVPEHRDRMRAERLRLLQGAEIRNDYKIIRPDGSERWIKDRANPIRNPRGEVYQFAGIAEDITEARNSREAVRRADEKLRRLVANIPDVIWTSDEFGGTPYISPNVENVLGLAPEDICKHGYERLRHIHPEDADRVMRAFQRLFTDGHPFSEQYRIQKKDGRWIWLHDRALATHEVNGIRYADGLFSDITEHKLSEAAVQKSEQKYRSLVRRIPDAVWTVDSERRVQFISLNIERLLGYSFGDFYRHGARIWFESIHPDDAARVSQAFEALFAKGQPYDVECRVRRKDGTWMWAHDRSLGTYEQNGVRYADGILSDVTERKRVEEDLRFKTAFLEAQTNSTVDGILVVDGEGKKILQNQRFIEMFSVPHCIVDDICDRVLLQYVMEKVKDPEQFLEKVTYLYEHPDETSRDEIEFKDGMVADRYSSPVTDKNGRYYGRIWTFRDITQRKHNEDVLRQLSSAVEQSPVSVVITDPEGNITYVNPKFTQVTGYSYEEAIKLKPGILESGFTKAEDHKLLWETIRNGGEWRGELCNKKKNGELYWESATIKPIVNGNGCISHFLATKEDITEHKVLERELQQAHKLEAVGQLAAGIAHEINTPIQYVTDNLMFLRDSWNSAENLLSAYRKALTESAGSLLPSEVRLALEKAESSADLEFISAEIPRALDQGLQGTQRVAKIVHAMKEFSHPDSGERTSVDINRAIETTITVARNEWKYVADVETNLDPALPMVACYAGEINQVILNLIVNAAHAIRDAVQEGQKGRILIGTAARGEFAEISIRDTGTGIPEVIRSRVFDPFFTTKEVGKGTGQGLSLAYSIVVKKHGGKIWFETQIGEGTTFFIHLPVHGSANGEA